VQRRAAILLAAAGCAAAAACHDVAPTATQSSVRSLAVEPDVGTAAKPEQSLVAYVTGRAGITDVSVMDVANGRSHSITRDRANAWSPVWSPNGSKIAYSSARGGSTQIWVMNADGTNQTRITDTTTGIESDPRWSARGIAFSANVDGTPTLFLINPDGTGLTQLSRESTPSYEPAWKP
jgi:Tol biopolymer transport system component